LPVLNASIYKGYFAQRKFWYMYIYVSDKEVSNNEKNLST
jgi:hypothetical protein